VAEENPEASVPLSKFMIEDPFTVYTKSNSRKAILIFHENSLRHLACIDHATGELEGIITREEVVHFLEKENLSHV